MIAVILAAGMGKRLMPLTKDRPKTLLKLNKVSILEQIISKCIYNQIKQYLVVFGYNGAKILEECNKLQEKYSIQIKCIENEHYSRTNTACSLNLAINEINDDFIIINGDNVFDREIIANLLESKYSAMVIDNFKDLNAESFKININNGIIRSIGKEIDIKTSSGEFIGISKVTKEDIPELKLILFKLINSDLHNYYDLAFKSLSEKSNVEFIYTNGLKWTEIDDLDDWKNAKLLLDELGEN